MNQKAPYFIRAARFAPAAVLSILVLLMNGCAVFGPPAIVLTRGDIAERAFVDRRDADLRPVFRGLDHFAVSGPDVGFQIGAQRLELAWAARMDESPFGLPIGLTVVVVGTPVINPTRNGIDLADAHVEQVKMPAIPFINADRNQVGDSLGTLPLLLFRSEELTRDGVVYQPTKLSVGAFGLRVDIAPK